jgi:hypothetical protein
VASGTIDYKTVCKEPVLVIPYGLGYFARDAIAELNTVLQRAGSKRTLEVPSTHSNASDKGSHLPLIA